MDGICQVKKINGKEWVVFETQFNDELTPDIIQFLSKHNKIRFPWDSYFNKSVNNLPNSITHLYFGSWFNQPVNRFPDSLLDLEFGLHFNQLVDNLPNSLTHLEFGYGFNQPINFLPDSLKYLKLGSNFNQSLENLPASLIRIEFGDMYDKPITDLPNNIREIKIGRYMDEKILKKFPLSLQKLIVPGDIYHSYENRTDKIKVPEHVEIEEFYYD